MIDEKKAKIKPVPRQFFQTDSANGGGGDYGKEFDLQFTYKATWKQTFGLKGAFYSTDAAAPIPGAVHSVDTNKVWVFTSYGI